MKIRNILSTIILVLVLTLTVGFSAFVSEMSISNLVADVRVEKDVRITGVEMIEGNAISKSLDYTDNSVFGSFSPSSDDTTLAQYKVTITNFGNVDIYFATCYVEELSGGYFDCIDGCGGEIISGLGNSHEMFFQIENDETMDSYFKVSVDFKEILNVSFKNINISDDTTTFDSIYTKYVGSEFKKTDFKVYMGGVLVSDDVWDVIDGELYVYGVYDDLVIERIKKVAKLVSGDLTTIGSEVCIGDECFNIIGNDGSTVTMLAKYNLYVGGTSDSSKNFTAYGDAATGIQNSTMIGWVEGTTKWQGTIEYSNSTQKGTNYSDYEGSVVQTYVNNYGSYLNSLGGYFNEIRLITTNELNSLGCIESSNSCENAKSFVLNTSFWTGTAYDNDYVWFVVTDGNYDKYIDSNRNDRFGVRPVIEMSVDDIYAPAVVVSGDYDTVGSEVCLSNECFYVISSTDYSVTMLSKYNLLVGNSVDENWNVTPLENSTGIQDSSARGLLVNDEGITAFPLIGTVPFSTTDTTSYEQSTIKSYVDNYGLYLNAKGFNLNDIRLLTFDEIMEFSHEELDGDYENLIDMLEYDFSSAPSWLYSTSYWLGSALDSVGVYRIDTLAFLHIEMIELNDDVGVRPVITISKDYF